QPLRIRGITDRFELAARGSHFADVDPELPGDAGGRSTVRPSSGVALDCPGQVDEGKAGLLRSGGLRGLGHERDDSGGPGFEVPRQLATRERSHGLQDQLGTLRFGIGCKTALQLAARLRPQPFRLHSMLPRGLQAVIAETQAEQETTEQAELDEVPLVMESMLETAEVKGLRDD